MRTINFNDPQELQNSFGKKCRVEYQAIGFPSEAIVGTLLTVQINTKVINTKVPSLRIVVEKDGVGFAIPTNHILSVEVDE